MKALFFEKHGEIDVLKYADLQDPTPAPGEALIRVRAAALNHLDIWVRRGWKGLHLEMPHITGSDIAGEIVSVNTDSVWSPGTKVIVYPGISTASDEWTRRGEESVSPGYKILGEQLRGGLAQLVCVPIGNVFKIPDGLSFEDAAAPLLVGTTCWRMLFKRAVLRPGETVLVVGAGGGVNSLSILLAKAAGATVYAVAGGKEKVDGAIRLGAEQVVDYKAIPAWHAEILKLTKGRGVDVVVDNVGQATVSKSLRALTRGGRLVTVGNTSGYDLSFDNRLIFTKQISILGSTMGSKQDFIECMQFMWKHKIKAPIDKVAGLEEGIKMIKRLEDGKQFGKIVLVP
jgi:NADPH:quinone reductase-like Zn-dependent oxidoreductase